jgi:UDP-N-acetylmuramoyl-tripeptide--D-alanyl-D-alanine ligase
MVVADNSAGFEPPSRLLIDPNSGHVLFDEHGGVLRQPASLAKLIMLYIVFELVRNKRCNLSDVLSMTQTAATVRGSKLGIPAGSALRLEEAIAALTVASANDVALVLAEHLSGSIPAFVVRMNAAARALGLESTHLVSAAGLDQPGQFTTARDIGRLAMRIYIDFPDYRHFFAHRNWTFAGTTINNTNRLLSIYTGMNGLKTGTTPRAGRHLVASAQRDERHLISVVMGCRTEAARDEMTVALLDAGFAAAPAHVVLAARSLDLSVRRGINRPAGLHMDWTWTGETLATALAWRNPVPLPPVSITSVQILTSACSPGALFVPLPFEMNLQGFSCESDAIAAAIDRGASIALTTAPQLPFLPSVPVVRVTPPMTGALAKLARFARGSYQGKVIAITGSIGKTTTKDLLHHVLGHAGVSFKTVSSSNSIGGICAVTINRPLNSQFTVVEVGASRAGHIRRAAIARPHIGIISNIGISHLGRYRNRQELFREKVSLFDHLEGDRIGIVHRNVLDEDDANERLIRSKRLSRLLTVGRGSDNDVHIADLAFDGIGTTGIISVLGNPYRFALPLPSHFVDNAMFALAAAGALDLDLAPLVAALATSSPTPRRCTRQRIVVEGGAIELIDDSFNAAPDSVSALLRILQFRSAARKVFVFGDMLSLGNDTVQLHKAIAPLSVSAGIDLVVTVGKLAPLAADKSVETINFPDADAASRGLPALLKPGDLIAVKGSRAMHLENVVQAILAMGRITPLLSWRIEDELVAADSMAPIRCAASIPERIS